MNGQTRAMRSCCCCEPAALACSYGLDYRMCNTRARASGGRPPTCLESVAATCASPSCRTTAPRTTSRRPGPCLRSRSGVQSGHGGMWVSEVHQQAAQSIKPSQGSRPMLRRTRALVSRPKPPVQPDPAHGVLDEAHGGRESDALAVERQLRDHGQQAQEAVSRNAGKSFVVGQARCWHKPSQPQNSAACLPHERLTISPSCRVVPEELISISMGSVAPCFSR